MHLHAAMGLVAALALFYRSADIVDQAERYEVSLVALCGILQAMGSGAR